MMDIPVIDLGGGGNGGSSRSEAEIVADLMSSCRGVGFATLVNHGVSADCMAKAFEGSKSFFDLPLDAKLRYPYQGTTSNRGYIAVGREAENLGDGALRNPETTTAAIANYNSPYKETLEIGREDEPGFQNEWPKELAETSFKEDLLEYFDQLDALHLRIMKWLAIGLELDDVDFLVDRCNERHQNLRLLHYPSYTVRQPQQQSSSRANLHTDYGTITLLAQDQVGGLQVLYQPPDASPLWIDVQPRPNALIMNVGEMLMRWSGDVLQATLHRVVAPPGRPNENDAEEETTTIPERYSIAFFCNPNKTTLLECLDSPLCKTGGNGRCYAPIQAHEYITQRLADTIKAPVVEL